MRPYNGSGLAWRWRKGVWQLVLLLLAVAAAAYAIVPIILRLVVSFAKKINASMADWDPLGLGHHTCGRNYLL